MHFFKELIAIIQSHFPDVKRENISEAEKSALPGVRLDFVGLGGSFCHCERSEAIS
jgi:hypothetical protein